MIFAPAPIGRNTLAPDILSEDKKGSRKIGPCALGKRAMYLNSFFVDRRYYVLYGEVSRAFKRVAMSKGGFTGKGAFGSIPYLVVQLKNGREQQCNFKYEEQVDTFLSALNKQHPEIKTVSAEAEKRLLAERAKEEARYVKHLSPAAEETLETLKAAKGYLEKEPEIPARLAGAAKDKRIMDRMNPAYRYAAAAIFLLALGALVFGVISIFRHQGYAMYFVLFGMAFLFYTMSAQILPTARRNKKYANGVWLDAVEKSRAYVAGYEGFPIPAQYAHPASFDRMIRVIREGKAETTADAWRVMKEELKAINASVTVSQTEYDEITAIKPMFLICDYEDAPESVERAV